MTDETEIQPAAESLPVKPWYASRTIWGAILTVLAPLVGKLAGVSFSDTDLADLATWLGEAGAVVGAAVVVWGRHRATARIGKAAG